MKTYTYFQKISLLLFVVAMITVLNSCSRKINFATSTVVPAANGQVTIKKDDNKNYAIEVNVRNLAEPNRLTPPRSVYVVWLQTVTNETRNLGQLKSSSGLFSNDLKASLKSLSPTEPNRVYITAEDNANITYPGPQVVLTTPNF